MPPEYYRSAVRSSVAKQALGKLGRLRHAGDGRLEGLGHDFDRGHRDYVERLPEGERLWLGTKPFSAPPNFELATCLRTFAHVVEGLGLGLRAQVLDVGCGPGWMSEFLARCGYWVTGIDISEDMVEIARLRVSRIPGQVVPSPLRRETCVGLLQPDPAQSHGSPLPVGRWWLRAIQPAQRH